MRPFLFLQAESKKIFWCLFLLKVEKIVIVCSILFIALHFGIFGIRSVILWYKYKSAVHLVEKSAAAIKSRKRKVKSSFLKCNFQENYSFIQSRCRPGKVKAETTNL